MAASAPHDYSIEEIKARLSARPIDLARRLGLDGRLSGNQFWVRDFRRKDGGNLSSFSIHVTRGVWKNFAGPDDEGGDFLRLIAVFACGGDNRKAPKWALDYLGPTGRTPDPAETRQLIEQAKKRKAQAEQEAARRRAAAKAIWLGARKLDGRDPPSLYLKARGIDVTALAGGIPSALRFDPACLAMPENIRVPAMLANVSGPGGHIATHRTYLQEKGGVWGKAWAGEMRDGKKIAAKRVLGEFVGGSVRLTRGRTGKPLAKADPDEWIVIAEGIENALTAALAMPELRCLASVSGSNLGNVALPPQVRHVYLVADNDTQAPAIAMFNRAMDNFVARGIEPVEVRAPAGIKDLNDMVRGNTSLIRTTESHVLPNA